MVTLLAATEADGVPKPTIKWRRESQFHLLPAPPVESEQDGGEEQLDGEGSSNETQTEAERPQMAPTSARLKRAHQTNPSRPGEY